MTMISGGFGFSGGFTTGAWTCTSTGGGSGGATTGGSSGSAGAATTVGVSCPTTTGCS